LLLTGLGAACQPSPVGTTDASPSNAVRQTIRVGERPGTPAVGAGAVWVPNTGDGTVSRIDPATGRVAATIRIGDAAPFYKTVCEPYGSVHSFMVTTFNIRRCDLPSAVDAGADAVWATKNDTNEIVRLDPATNRIITRVPVGIVPFDLLVTADAVWVSSYEDDAVVRVDPGGRVVATIRMPGKGPSGLAAAGGSLWVANSRAGSVSRIDTGANQVTATIPMTCRGQCLAGPVPLPLAATTDQVWTRNEGDGSVARIDPRSDRVVASIDVDAFYGRDGQDAIAVTPSGIWFTGIKLQRIDPKTNQVARDVDETGITLAYGYGFLWVTDIVGRVLRIDPGR
jgi:YVTN family beta-propeller protein